VIVDAARLDSATIVSIAARSAGLRRSAAPAVMETEVDVEAICVISILSDIRFWTQSVSTNHASARKFSP
jgi:hypothetical protein